MIAAVAAHYIIEMAATIMYISLLNICTNPKHDHNKVLVLVGRHKLTTQAILAVPMAWVTVILIDSVLIT